MASCRITIKSSVKPQWIDHFPNRTAMDFKAYFVGLPCCALPGVWNITSVHGLSWDHATKNASVIFPLKWPGISSHLHMQKTKTHIYIYIYMSYWLVVYLPLWKIWKSVGSTIPNLWKNKKIQTTNLHTHTYIYISLSNSYIYIYYYILRIWNFGSRLANFLVPELCLTACRMVQFPCGLVRSLQPGVALP